MQLHRSLVRQRCPELLDIKLDSVPIDHECLRIFESFLYSDLLPDGIEPLHLMGLAFLFQTAGMHAIGATCLKRLQTVRLTDGPERVTSLLIKLYCLSLDLGPFTAGEHAALYLLRKHRKIIGRMTPQIPALLGSHGYKFMELMVMFVENSKVGQPDLVESLSGTTIYTMGAALRKMYDCRDEDGHFDIVIKDCAPRKVHAFVLYSAASHRKRRVY
eukprot:TRINITY_DN1438_c0_g1_i1.p1 TRINITY_DN1438_c0_g1~~TRINITY_DN1438_c0_g1_i1.p1  ORF type:complete len:216 (+),score=29.27 TRINITY_DN1438_c0_g1_i1:659-1306(+)